MQVPHVPAPRAALPARHITPTREETVDFAIDDPMDQRRDALLRNFPPERGLNGEIPTFPSPRLDSVAV